MISLVSEKFVPVAVNLYKLRKAKTEEGKFYRSVLKQNPTWMGVWIVSPAGKVLAHHHNPGASTRRLTAEVSAALKSGLDKFGKVTSRKYRWRHPLPHRGAGVLPDGSVKLAVYIRQILGGKPTRDCILDSVSYSAKEFEGFAPPNSNKGISWIVPADVARKFCRCLSPESDLSTMPSPEEVNQVRLTGKIVDIRNGTAILTYQGSISAVHRHPSKKNKTNRGSAAIEGVAEYDLNAKQMKAIAFTFDGVYHMFQPWHRDARQTIAGLEWHLRQIRRISRRSGSKPVQSPGTTTCSSRKGTPLVIPF